MIGRVHQHLINKGVRLKASLIVVSGEIRDAHDLSCHIAYGASAVWPYLALEKARLLSIDNPDLNLSPAQAQENYRDALNKGLLKIMSKMGISVLSSYRGGCNFETVGLSRTIVNEYFPGVTSKISGIGLVGIEKKIREIHKEAFESTETVLPIGGIYRYRKNGETHQYQGKLIHLLQSAVGSNSYEAYKKYADGIYNLPPINLRDLVDFRKKN